MVDAAGFDSSTLQPLQARQQELLDTIDSLRGLGVDRDVDLPQIIVVGDQSAGKSSVLEAISGVRFPVHGGLCTRFATELVLRSAPAPAFRVSIRPCPEDAEEVRQRLARFGQRSRTDADFGIARLPALVEEAKAAMGIADGTRDSFSRRILRVEVCGPEVPQLTLVDLPGFYHSRTHSQPSEGQHVVNALVAEYMRQPSSIILAVVSAANQLALQKVLEEAAAHDPSKARTLGIVTKVDLCDQGSSDESTYLNLVCNSRRDPNWLAHGWHVLRNRREREVETANDQRDAREAEFLNSGVWRQIPARDKGIVCLRDKLSRVLLRHVEKSLPGVVESIDRNMRSAETQLAALGDARDTPKQHREHLERVASQYSRLAEQAVEGDYRDSHFFGDVYSLHYQGGGDGLDTLGDDGGDDGRGRGVKLLRARVRDLNNSFVAVMMTRGANQEIQWRDPGDAQLERESRPHLEPEELEALLEQYQISPSVPVSQDEFEAGAERLARRCQGRQFPGSFNDRVTLKLFEQQADRWEGVARRHVELAVYKCEAFVANAFAHVTGVGRDTYDRLMVGTVAPFFEDRRAVLHAKITELLPSYSKTGYSLPLEFEFERRVGSRSQRLLRRQVGEFVAFTEGLSDSDRLALYQGRIAETAVNSPSQGVRRFAIQRLIDNMVEYYAMTLRTFIENVVILAVENQLMAQIPAIFTSAKVVSLDDATLEALSAESEEVRTKRTELQDQLQKLKAGLAACRKHRIPAAGRGHPARPSLRPPTTPIQRRRSSASGASTSPAVPTPVKEQDSSLEREAESDEEEEEL